MGTTIKKLMSAAVAAAICLVARATTDFVGSWNGKLDLGVAKLRIVINVSADGSCTLVSPDQSAKGIPAKFKTPTPDTMEVSASSIGAKFVGRIKGEALSGTFTQNGMNLPLELKREPTKVNRPQTPRSPFPYETAEVVFTNTSAGAVLAGTLSIPANAKSVALMVTGSGQQNRDEELFGHKPFAVIADYLARKGIATLR